MLWSRFLWAVNAHTIFKIHEGRLMSFPDFIESIAMEIHSMFHKVQLSKYRRVKGLHPILAQAMQPIRLQPSPQPVHVCVKCHPHMCNICCQLPAACKRRTSKTTFFCYTCGVYLHCNTRVPGGSSCWDRFHNTINLLVKV